MIIGTTKNEVLYDTYKHECPDYWPLRLMHVVFSETLDSDWYINANIKGIFEVINELEDREKKVILMRFKDKLNLQDTAKELGITRERCRQIEAKALRKMRHPMRSKRMLAVSKKDFEDATSELNILKLQQRRDNDPDGTDPASVMLEDLNFSVRTYNCLKRAGYTCLADFVDKSAWDLGNVRNLGMNGIDEIFTKLDELNITMADKEDFIAGFVEPRKEFLASRKINGTQ